MKNKNNILTVLVCITSFVITICFSSCEPPCFDYTECLVKNNRNNAITMEFSEWGGDLHIKKDAVILQPGSSFELGGQDYEVGEFKTATDALNNYLKTYNSDTILIKDTKTDTILYIYSRYDTTMYEQHIFRVRNWRLLGIEDQAPNCEFAKYEFEIN